MSIGHSEGHKPHKPDMPKDEQDVTSEEKQEARRKIEGSTGEAADGRKVPLGAKNM